MGQDVVWVQFVLWTMFLLGTLGCAYEVLVLVRYGAMAQAVREVIVWVALLALACLLHHAAALAV